MCLTVCATTNAAGGCGIGFIANMNSVVNKGLKQKDIPHLLSDLYSKSEIRRFQSLAYKAATQAPIVEQGFSRSNIYSLSEMETALSSIIQKLAAQWEHDVPELKLSVTSSLYYTAFVTQDAHILLPIGFLRQSNTDDELAFILAHELSHVLLGHARSLAKQQSDKRMVREVKANLKTMTSISKIQLNNKRTFELAEQEKLDSINRRISTYHRRIQRSMMDVIHPIWNKKQEDEADLLGLELAFKAGYSPDGVADALQNISDLQESGCEAIRNFGNELSDFMRTEASPMLMQAVNEESMSPLRMAAQQLEKFSSKKAEKMLIAQALPKSHRKKEKRLKYAWEYTDRAAFEDIFAAVEDVLPGDEVIGAVKNSKEYTRTLSSAHAVERTYDALQNDNVSLAAKTITPVDKTTQEGKLLMYSLQKTGEDKSKAIANLELALTANHPAREIMEVYAEEHLLQGNKPPVQQALKRMVDIYRDEHYFLPEKIYIESSRKESNRQIASDMVRRCIKSRRGYLDGPCRAAELGTRADFRTEYKQILEAQECKVDEHAGGDVECLATSKSNVLDFSKIKLFSR